MSRARSVLDLAQTQLVGVGWRDLKPTVDIYRSSQFLARVSLISAKVRRKLQIVVEISKTSLESVNFH